MTAAKILVTEQETEQHLPEQERWVATMLRSISDAVLATDSQGRITVVNPAAEMLTGWSQEEALGRNLLEVCILIDERSRTLVECPAQTILRTDQPTSPAEPTLLVARDGSEIPVEYSAAPIRDDQGQTSGAIMIVRDVGKRRRAEQARIESERKRAEELDALQATVLDSIVPYDLPPLLETIVERAACLLAAPVGGLYLSEPEHEQVRCVVSYNTSRDYRGTTLKYGEGAAGIVAQSGEPLLIADYSAWLGRASVYEQEQPFRAIVAAPMTWQGRVTGVIDIVHYDPAERFTEDDLKLLVLFANHAALVVENARLYEQVQRELTERKRLEQQSEERRLYLERVLDCAPEAIVTTDARHRVLEWNPGAERLFGYTPAEAMGHDLDELIAVHNPGMLEQATGFTGQILNGRPVPPTETTRYRKDGSPVQVTVAGAPILVEEKPIGVVAAYTDITRRKQVEAALRESKDRYRDLVEHSLDLICTHDLEGWVLSVNLAAARLLGYSVEELLQMNIRDILIPEVREKFDEYLAQIQQEGVSSGLMYVQTRSGEKRIWQYDNTLRIKGVDKPIVRGTARDITEQVRAQQAVRRSEAQYRATLNAMADAIHVVDRDLRIVLFNDACRQWNTELGLRTDVIGLKLSEVFPFLSEATLAQYEHVFRTGERLVTTETTQVAGQTIITDTRKIPLFQDDSVIQVITVIRDVTERERAAEEIRQLVEFNQGIVQNMAEGIAVQDAAGNLTFLNPAAVRLLGYEAEELAGQHWTLVVPPDQQPIIKAADRRRLEGKADRYEVELVRKDGRRVPVLISGNPRFKDGHFDGTLAVFTDISGRVQAEEALARHAQEMAALYETSLEINSQPDIPTLLPAIVQRAAQLLEAPMGSLYLLRPSGQELELVVGYNLPEHYIGTSLHLGEGLSGRIAQTGEPLMVDDYGAWPGRASAYDDTNFRRVLGVPLKFKGRVIGVINITDSVRVGPFREEEVRLVSLFADQAAIAIENARLLEAEARRRREAETLQAATLALTATLDLQQVFASILRELRQVVPYDSASVQRLSGDRLEIIGGHGFPNLEELLGIDFDLNASDNPNREVIRSRASLILADAPAIYERFRQEPHAQAGIRAWLGVPLLFGERLIGMLALDKQEPGFYTEEHAQLAQAFAAQAAIAIENARLFQETQQRLNELRLLFDTSTALSTSLDPDRVMRIVTQRIVDALHVQGCTISSWDRERDALVSLMDHVLDSAVWQAEAAGTVYHLADYPATRKVLVKREPHAFRLQDPQIDPAERAWMAGEKVQVLLMVPMIVRDNVIGLLELLDGRRDRVFNDTEIALCQTLANQAAAALENARLLQAERVAREQAEKHAADLRDRERFLTLLNDITRAALETPDLPTMVQTLADRLADLLEADGCFLTFWDEARQLTLPAAANGPMRDIYPSIRLKPDDPTMTRTVLESGQALFEEDFEHSIYASPPLGIGPKIRSQMALPLIAGDEKLGAAIFSFINAHRFTPDEVTRGEQIARQVALALAKAKLVQSEREQRELAEVLREAAQVMTTSLELGEILRLLLDQLKRVLVYDTASVLIFRGGHVPDLITGIGYADERMTSQEASLLLQNSPILQRMAQNLQPVVSDDVRHLEGWTWVPGAEHVRSWMGVPLVAHGRMIGALMVDHSQAGFFGQTEVQLAQTLAQHAAQAVDNARLYEAEQRRAREAAAVSTVVQALNATTRLDSIFQAIAQELHQLLHFDRLSIALSSPDQEQFTMYALSAEPGAPLPPGLTLPTASTACAADLLAGRPHLTPDLAAELDFAAERALYEGGLRSRLNLPLRLGETVIGALNLASARRNAFSAEQVPLLTQIADAVAAAIQNAQLYEETLRRNRELALLNRVIAASAAQTAIEPILETVCRELALALDAARTMAILFHLDKGEAKVVAEHVADAPWVPLLNSTFSIANNPLTQHLLEHKTLLVVQDAQTDPRFSVYHDLQPFQKNGSFFVLPILVHGQVAGSLSVSAAELRLFSDEELSLAQRVTEQVSGALVRAQLAESQRRLSAAVDQAAEAIAITDTNGAIVYVNPALEKITGFPPQQFIGFGPHSTRGTECTMDLIRRLWEQAALTEMWQGRFTGDRADGSPYTVDAALAPVRNEAGEMVNYVATMRDVTREVQLEAQIRQAQKMEALGQLAGGIAHDFNNLLTVITLSTQLLKRRLHPQDPLWEHVVRIEETGERATKLTKQLLSFSRREVIEPQVLSLNQVVGDLSRMLKRVIGEDIELETRLANDLWPVKVDPSQMDQVIMNLVINARDAMPQGGTLTIETANVVLDQAYVEAHMDARPGKHVLLSISDTGVGMEDEIRSHLFEPFFTTKDRGQGTGLGLATVFGIIRQSGGHISVASEVGRGTTFKIYLSCSEGTSAKTLLTSPARATGEPLAGSETILVVEDKADVRRLAVTVLHSYGYHVLEAGDGLEALQVAGQHGSPIHLLLTDVIMPRMNGKALAQELSQHQPEMRVLYMSGYADNAILEQGALAPGAIFLAKPFSVEGLVQKVRAVLDDRL